MSACRSLGRCHRPLPPPQHTTAACSGSRQVSACPHHARTRTLPSARLAQCAPGQGASLSIRHNRSRRPRRRAACSTRP
eukprot:3511060-Prymnesium_polylepis.1